MPPAAQYQLVARVPGLAFGEDGANRQIHGARPQLPARQTQPSPCWNPKRSYCPRLDRVAACLAGRQNRKTSPYTNVGNFEWSLCFDLVLLSNSANCKEVGCYLDSRYYCLLDPLNLATRSRVSIILLFSTLTLWPTFSSKKSDRHLVIQCDGRPCLTRCRTNRWSALSSN